MSKQFLRRLLSIKHCVNYESSQDCIICLEKCGILSPDRATMELEMRLPCGHSVGSRCITTWLAENNTCPLCRYEFFPRQPRPYMEHDLMQETEDQPPTQVERLPDESDEAFLARLSRNSESHDNPLAFALVYSQQVHLSLRVAFLALNIADTADRLSVLSDSSAESIAAASVYIASNILYEPRSLADIARQTNVDERTIHFIYRAVYQDRFELIDEDWRGIVGGETLGWAAETLCDLCWPPLEPDFTDGEDEDDERMQVLNDNVPSVLDNIGLVRDLCFEFQWDSHNTYRHTGTSTMAKKIANRMAGMVCDWNTVNPWTIAAACTYMAASLVFKGRTLTEVGAMSGIPPALIRRTYQVMYSVRMELVPEEWFEIAPHTRSEALFCLPEP